MQQALARGTSNIRLLFVVLLCLLAFAALAEPTQQKEQDELLQPLLSASCTNQTDSDPQAPVAKSPGSLPSKLESDVLRIEADSGLLLQQCKALPTCDKPALLEALVPPTPREICPVETLKSDLSAERQPTGVSNMGPANLCILVNMQLCMPIQHQSHDQECGSCCQHLSVSFPIACSVKSMSSNPHRYPHQAIAHNALSKILALLARTSILHLGTRLLVAQVLAAVNLPSAAPEMQVQHIRLQSSRQ